jgi:hypothetical protein
MRSRILMGLGLVLCVACGDSEQPTGPDFERELAPGEYQVSVTGDVRRSFEGTGAYWFELSDPALLLYAMGDADALDGAEFILCAPPSPAATYEYDAVTEFAGCPSEPGRVAGGFIIQLGAPQADELDCYPNGYGDKDFEGVLTITSVTAEAIEGEARGSGTCSRHPHSEIEPMGSATVSVQVRFRAERETG